MVSSIEPSVVRTVATLRQAISARGGRVALVPTMGALHDGHLELVKAAKSAADSVVVSLFVNPTQFAPHEDFAAYPRDEAADLAKLAPLAPLLVYAPDVAEMYPEGDATTVTVTGPAAGLESEARPHFFAGVATVVTRLFLQVMPQVAIFGEKDYQQLLVIRRLVRDLAFPVEIVGVPVVRAPDGLALSSRNAYLSASERAVAPVLHRTLADVARRVRAGGAVVEETAMATRVLIDAGFASVDYIAVRDAETLAPLTQMTGPARVLAATKLGRTRLIDNVPA